MKVWKFIITKLTNAKPQKQKQTTPPPQKKTNRKNKTSKTTTPNNQRIEDYIRVYKVTALILYKT